MDQNFCPESAFVGWKILFTPLLYFRTLNILLSYSSWIPERNWNQRKTNGHALVHFRSTSGPLPVYFIPTSGPLLIHFRSTSGPLPIHFRSTSCPLWSTSGPLSVHFCSTIQFKKAEMKKMVTSKDTLCYLVTQDLKMSYTPFQQWKTSETEIPI